MAEKEGSNWAREESTGSQSLDRVTTEKVWTSCMCELRWLFHEGRFGVAVQGRCRF